MKGRLIRNVPEREITPALRSESNVPRLSAVRKRVVLDAEEEATRIIERARREASEALRVASVEAVALRQTARQEGVEQGLRGLVELAARFEQLQLELAERRKLDIQRSAYEIARYILSREVATHPEVILELVEQVLKKISSEKSIKMCVHPSHVPIVRNQLDRLTSDLRGVEQVRIVEDPRLEPGDCRLETDLGNLDARIVKQIEKLQLQQSGGPRPQLEG